MSVVFKPFHVRRRQFLGGGVEPAGAGSGAPRHSRYSRSRSARQTQNASSSRHGPSSGGWKADLRGQDGGIQGGSRDQGAVAF